MNLITFQEELRSIVRSRSSFLYVVTEEEERFLHYLEKQLNFISQQAIYIWDFATGYSNIPGTLQNSSKSPVSALDYIASCNVNVDAIFVLKDFGIFMNDPLIQRKVCNLSGKTCPGKQVIICLASEIILPDLLVHHFNILSFPLPNRLEIQFEISRLFNVFNKQVNSDMQEHIISLCQGLSMSKIRSIITRLCLDFPILGITHLNYINDIKKKQLQQNNLLELPSITENLDNIGGLANLKQWISIRSLTFSNLSLSYGIPYPKGILLVGIPGTGKSMTAKAIADSWNLLLLRLDFGRLFTGVVGQSEENMRRMIQMVEASSPCILWIDEIDKIFHKSMVEGDSGTSRRLLGAFLIWLQERHKPVFVVATANNVSALPTEIVRKGRFDEIFFLDLPSYDERKQIFMVHLAQLRPHTWHNYNIPVLAKYSHLFSGSEIQQVLINAMCNAFIEHREFTSEDILCCIQELIPLAFIDKENIQYLQSWVYQGRAKLA